MATYSIKDLSPVSPPPKPPPEPPPPGAPPGQPQPQIKTPSHDPAWNPLPPPPPPGPPKKSKEGSPGEPQKPGQGKPDPQQGQGEPPKPNAKPQPASADSENHKPDVDKIYKDLEKKLSEKKDTTGQNPQPLPDPTKQKGQPGGGNGNAPIQISTQVIKPKYSWKQLLEMFVTSKSSSETTYKKISRSSVTGVSAADEFGAGAVKPGERELEEAFKLVFCFDSSGSMYGVIEKALAEAANLIKANSENVDAALGVTMFADSPMYYAANLGAKKYWPIASFSELDRLKVPTNTLPIAGLFKAYISGSTVFGPALATQLGMAVSRDYNIIIFTDDDITYGSNWDNFLALFKRHPKNIYLIAADINCYQSIVKKLGIQPNNFGHLS